MAQKTLIVLKITTYVLLGDEFLKILLVDTRETWITPYQHYLVDGLLPAEPTEAKTVKRNVGRNTLINGKLLRHDYTHPVITCVSGNQHTCVMAELHEGIFGSHIRGRTLLLKVIRDGFYWSTMKEDFLKYA